MRVQTMSSLRNPGHLMRAGMNILTTQVNSLRDYCGVITGHPINPNYLFQQHGSHQEQLHDLRYSPAPNVYLRPNRITTISEEDEAVLESTSLMQNELTAIPYVGHTSSTVVTNASGIGNLNHANSSALAALNNFTEQNDRQSIETEILMARGQMSGGIGIFQGGMHEQEDELIDEPERLIMYGQQRPPS